eukprot:2235990-Lingulodinium_polyedra.AAC.1
MESDEPAATGMEIDADPALHHGAPPAAPPPPPVGTEGRGLCPICQHNIEGGPMYRWPRCRHQLHQ